MWGDFSPGECTALYRLVAGSARDLVLKLDRRGRVVHASPASARLGLAFAGDPVGRHLLELLHPSCAHTVMEAHRAVQAGEIEDSGWIEVLAQVQNGDRQWFELKLGPLPCDGGTVGLLRSIDDRRALEDQLFTAAMTDPLTHLSNRDAFVRMLHHLIDAGAHGHVALFDLDHLRTLNLRHGHSGGDRVLVAFAHLMQKLLGPDDILSRIAGGTFGVLLTETAETEAASACYRILEALDAASPTGHSHLHLTASAGLAPFGSSPDATLRAAELALVNAKARGRNRLERAEAHHQRWGMAVGW
ncbi:MAG: diguanylate cyclase domain-containing protein [Tsuneonella suprasediminis]|uniref:GGDEF domain-containing protein n=1 Tax=Tsuneonella suprasediminis TaxID=2306996 RepID=A0A419R2Z7_9SPHN|nr:GGDEF domain-containing protein [Tsuneonella suprasediminis]RJX68535.1 GGDEF domain-containing protein [Tsuneonella suprasediminis]UBS31646.1 GGDEF domain-containing protein [Altererythrobacter sp. N1]